MLDVEPTPGGLVKFHTAHKLTLMAHSPKHYTEIGRFVADVDKRDWDKLTAEYGAQLLEGLGVLGAAVRPDERNESRRKGVIG